MLRIEQEYISTSPFGNLVEMFEDFSSNTIHILGDDEIGIDVDYGTSLSSCQH